MHPKILNYAHHSCHRIHECVCTDIHETPGCVFVHVNVTTWLRYDCTFVSIQNFSIEKIIVEIFWGSTGKTKPSRPGPKGAFYKASVTSSHAPSFLYSGVFETAISADFVHASTWRWRRGRKASAISKLAARFFRNQELRYTTASGESYSQQSVGTPWNPTTTARGNCTSRQRLARLPMTNGHSVEFSCI